MADAEVKEPLLVAVPLIPSNQDAVKEERRWRGAWWQICGSCAPHDVAACGLSYYAPCIAFGWNSSRALGLSAWKEALKFLFIMSLSFAIIRGTWEAVVYVRCGPDAFQWHADGPMAMHDEGRLGDHHHILPQQVMPGFPVLMNDYKPHKPCPFMHDQVEGFEGQLDALPFMLRGQEPHSEPLVALVDPAIDAHNQQPYRDAEHPSELLGKPIQAMLIAHSIVTVAAVEEPVVYNVQHSTATTQASAANDAAAAAYEYGYAYQPDEMYLDDGDMTSPEDETKPQQADEDQVQQLDNNNDATDENQETFEDEGRDMDLVRGLVADEIAPRMWVDPNVPANDETHKKKHDDDDDLEEYLQDFFEDVEHKLEECATKLGFAPCALLALTVSVAIYATYWAALRRKLMRERFGIPGDFKTDLLLWGCCSTCALAQETRTMIHNNVEEGIWQGAQQQQPSCVVWYTAPAPLKVVDNADAV